jgi:N-methylhydantoinase B
VTRARGKQAILGRTLDPFTLEIVKDGLSAAADEMGVVLARTSMSPIVYEVLDFACGLTDEGAQVVAQTNGLTLFTGTFGPQVESVLRRYGEDLAPGDIYMTNNPYEGGTHICDVCLVAPIFSTEQLVGFAVSITHWIEIGGAVPWSIPVDATEIFQEGLVFPCIRLARGGSENEVVRHMIRANVRLPRLALGDLDAGIAAVRIGERRVQEICERYGVGALREAMRDILERGERMSRAELATIPNAVYQAEDFIDGDGLSDDPLPIRVEVRVEDETLTADFTGCSPQARGPINCTWGALHSACKTVFRAITNPRAPSNEGCFRPFTILCPPGTVFTATPPAPTGWYYEGSAFATELVWKALAPVIPERLGAGSYLSLSVAYITGTNTETGEIFVLAEPADGGWGGAPTLDGESVLIATTDGDTYNFPVEVVEARYPVRVERYTLNTADGGGAGRRRGGFGVVREYRIVNEDGASSYGSVGGSMRRPWGLFGGRPGSNNYLEYLKADGERIRRGRVRHVDLAHGDVVRIVTGTGGGFGDPLTREPERVQRDVRRGYLSRAQARKEYGVVLAPNTLAIDEEATRRLRGEGNSS